MGKDLWAGAQSEAEPDQLQVALPISLLVFEPVTIRDSPAHQLSGMLSKVEASTWESWEEDISSPDPVIRLPQVELSIQAKICVQNFSTSASVLIDTGCRIPLLFRQNLIPSKFITQAKQPIQILTADNTPMLGGQFGCTLTIFLPILTDTCNQETGFLRCDSVFAYMADVKGSDIVLGYPFLKSCNLIVDCPCDGLRCMPTSTRRSLHHVHARPTSGSTTSSSTPCPTSPTPCPTTTPCSTAGVANRNPRAADNYTVIDGLGSVCSMPPLYPPGSKAKRVGSKASNATSSRPVTSLHRATTGNPVKGLSMTHPANTQQHRSPSGVSASGPPVEPPPNIHPPSGNFACTSNFAPARTDFQCTQCQRISPFSNFDCGCMIGEFGLAPVRM